MTERAGQRRRGIQESQERLVQTGTGLRQKEQGFFCSKSQEGRTQHTWPRAVLSGEVSGASPSQLTGSITWATPPARPPHLASPSLLS